MTAAITSAAALAAAARALFAAGPAALPVPALMAARTQTQTPAGGGACAPGDDPAAAPPPGIADPFHVPAPAATQLNADGKVLYRQARWDEARAKYRAALAADPDFLAPALNIACSFVRQERWADATAEVLALVARAYLPWRDEVLTAADLGALKPRPEQKQIQAALDRERQRWAERLDEAVLFVARTRPPLKLGGPAAGPATLVLGPHQEVFAWSARTRRYRQLTSEEGRVLAVARSPDGRRMAYATAEKLVRREDGGLALRGVAVKEVALGTLSVVGQAAIDGDVSALAIVSLGGAGDFTYRIDGPTAPSVRRLAGERWEILAIPPAVAGRKRALVTLTGQGVAPGATPIAVAGPCRVQARDARTPAGTAGVRVTSLERPPRSPALGPPVDLTIGGPHGAGLGGLPIP